MQNCIHNSTRWQEKATPVPDVGRVGDGRVRQVTRDASFDMGTNRLPCRPCNFLMTVTETIHFSFQSVSCSSGAICLYS